MAKYPGMRPEYPGNDEQFGKYYIGSNKSRQLKRKKK